MSAQCKYKNDSVSAVLHSTLVMFPFLGKSDKKKKFPERVIFFVWVFTESCLRPQACQMIPAERPSHWSPPTDPLLAESRWSPAPSRSPPPEPES